MGEDYRPQALQAGANVLMPNFTPAAYKKLYEIYPGKRCVSEPTGACAFCMEGMVSSIGRFIDYGRGDSLKGGKGLHAPFDGTWMISLGLLPCAGPTIPRISISSTSRAARL